MEPKRARLRLHDVPKRAKIDWRAVAEAAPHRVIRTAELRELGVGSGTIAGRTHIVYSGVTVMNLSAGYRDTRVAETEVRMLPLTEHEIAWYVATGEPLDKAGAYAAQGIGGMFIDSIHGSFTNVVGLPLALLFQMLRKAGLDPRELGS